MHIEIVAIGNELLSGFTVNTNASFISEQLLNEGWRVARHTVLPDDEEVLRLGLKESLERSNLVILTGGLGPTCDDLTRKIVAELFSSDFHFNEEIAADLKRRYGEQLLSIVDQATIPSKAQILKNKVGTASGLVFHENGKTMILLPGVPPEMKAMWFDQVVPYLQKHFQKSSRHYKKRLNFIGISESMVDPVLRELIEQFPDVEYGIYPGQMILGVHLTTNASDAPTAMDRLEGPFKVLLEKFGEKSFDASSGKIEEAVHKRFMDGKITLAAAESCTGGSVSSHLTRLPGSSQYFLGSIVAYSNGMKTEWLDVPEKLLSEKGAVSEEVVSSMLQGLFSKTACDYAIAVSGIAGPSGGTPEKPVGTVWLGVGKRGKKPHLWLLKARGNREMVIERSVNVLLGGLLQYMAEHDKS